MKGEGNTSFRSSKVLKSNLTDALWVEKRPKELPSLVILTIQVGASPPLLPVGALPPPPPSEVVCCNQHFYDIMKLSSVSTFFCFGC